LQLLVENAVKHNTASVEAPLVIRIFAEGNKLIVKNNLQKRKTAISSYNIGLTNIISKYRLLTNAELEISETSDEFNVVVPLLSKSI
jgi:LytS/YehU family sensor histidine kinase